jgi:HK97 family phage portal protein
MPLFDRLLGSVGLARKAGPPRGPVELVNRGGESVRISGPYTAASGSLAYDWGYAPDYVRAAHYGYQRNSDVYACVSLISSAAKQVKWWDGSGMPKTSPAILAKLIARSAGAEAFRSDLKTWRGGTKAAMPSPAASLKVFSNSGGATFLENWISYMLLNGNAFNEVARDEGNRPEACFLHRPDRVYANPPGEAVPAGSRPGTVVKWQVTLTGGITNKLEPFTQTERGALVHSRLFNPLSDIYGMPPLLAALLQIAAKNEGNMLLGKLFARGYSPAWVSIPPGSNWNETKNAALREKINASKQLGEELFLEGPEWHSMADGGGGNLWDAVLGQHNLTKRDIAAVYHVDPILIGDTESRTYATYKESRNALYMEAVLPLLAVFIEDWNTTIGRELNSPLDIDRDSFDAISSARAEAADRVSKLFSGGIIDQTEARADLEYDPARPGQVFYAPASQVELGVQGEE